jgi:tetratricopeptide (TPR) repeat protein
VQTRELFATGMRHWDAGRRRDAIAAFREIIRLDPDTPDAHYNLGFAYFRSGCLSEAVDFH